VPFLGHVISPEGMAMDPGKVVMSWIGSCQNLFIKYEVFLAWEAIIEGLF
jgi:hypothetical protein